METVLQRKAHAQRKALGGGAVTMPRALGRGLSIAADALWGLGLVAVSSGDDVMTPDRAIARLGDDQLLIILEHDTGPVGLVALDRELVTGFIEVQTLGKVTRFPNDTRAYTPTDAAMMAPLLDAALPRFASMLAGQPDMAHLQNYVFGALVEDAQIAGLALEAEQYQLTAFDVSLAQDARTGRAIFLFPAPPKPIEKEPLSETGKHAAVLKLAPARMQAILTRIHIPLDKAQALKPGDVLNISSQAMSSATLVMSGGHVVARGKLGQMNGFRAIRVAAEETPLHKAEQDVQTRASVPEPQVPAAPRTSASLTAQSPPSYSFDGGIDLALDDLTTDRPSVTGLAES